jgi:hypothetical protein
MDYGVMDYGDMNCLQLFALDWPTGFSEQYGIPPYSAVCGDQRSKNMA